MWTFITQLLVTLVLLGFFLVSCQNVMHIVQGSLYFVLKHIHQELDKELGESEGLSDDEETVSTRVIRRRVFLKVMPDRWQDRAEREDQKPGPEGTLQCCVQGGAGGSANSDQRHVGREGPGLWKRGLCSVLGARTVCGMGSEPP
jgi:hypothetical protein